MESSFPTQSTAEKQHRLFSKSCYTLSAMSSHYVSLYVGQIIQEECKGRLLGINMNMNQSIKTNKLYKNILILYWEETVNL